VRGEVRDRIYEHIEDRQAAGLTAALVVGDQQAIDGARQKSRSSLDSAKSLISLS
jgi:hypothetical protein